MIAQKRVQRSQRSYGNTTAAIVAITWKPGFTVLVHRTHLNVASSLRHSTSTGSVGEVSLSSAWTLQHHLRPVLVSGWHRAAVCFVWRDRQVWAIACVPFSHSGLSWSGDKLLRLVRGEARHTRTQFVSLQGRKGGPGNRQCDGKFGDHTFYFYRDRLFSKSATVWFSRLPLYLV